MVQHVINRENCFTVNDMSFCMIMLYNYWNEWHFLEEYKNVDRLLWPAGDARPKKAFDTHKVEGMLEAQRLLNNTTVNLNLLIGSDNNFFANMFEYMKDNRAELIPGRFRDENFHAQAAHEDNHDAHVANNTVNIGMRQQVF